MSPKLLFTSVATVLSAMLAAGPAPVQAAPPCGQWNFLGHTRFIQSNGWVLEFDAAGTTVAAPARAHAGGLAPAFMSGTVTGSIDRYAVNLQVRWDGGSLGKYEGSVDANGFAHGVTYDAAHPESHATWNSEESLGCNISGRF